MPTTMHISLPDIIFKFLKTKNKVKILKSAKEKRLIIYKEIKMKITADLVSKYASQEKYDTIKVLTG